MKKIDFEAHYYSPSLMEYLASRKEYPTYVREESMILFNQFGGVKGQYKMEHLQEDAEARIRIMNEHGISTQVLSLSIGPEFFPAEENIEWAKRCNDYVYEISKRYPGRFVGLAVLPVQDVQASIRELERCVKELGFLGWNCYSNFLNKYPDDPEYIPLFDKTAELDAVIYMHPHMPFEKRLLGMGAQLTGASFGFGVDTSTTVMRLILSGLFDRNPNLKMIMGHLGEIFPYILERMDEHAIDKLGHPAANKKLPGYYFKKNIWVTTSGNFCHASLECCVKVLGIDRILFGGDYPYETAERIDCFCAGMTLSAKDQEKIFYKNAAQIGLF